MVRWDIWAEIGGFGGESWFQFVRLTSFLLCFLLQNYLGRLSQVLRTPADYLQQPNEANKHCLFIEKMRNFYEKH